MNRIKKCGRVIVDADACPQKAKHIIVTLAKKYCTEVIMVASFNHNLVGEFEVVVVGNEPEAADLTVINLTKKGDIVVTQDWGLAAVLLGKGVHVVSPHGKIYCEEKMDFLLEQRHIKAKIRRSGGKTKGPSARTKEDDEHFSRALEELLLKSSS
ncbi:MAG: hypothetical protein CVU87_13415 [Firmicutes bacterium HGW-Firmicutes-12]|jgi:hypothetical protein|nr:MAG: hypothetical protein CVU87_13415 [Firmicutes bacterium HGW-Firmicutes-12]